MTKRPVVIEIEKQGKTYRVELRERNSGRALDSRTLDGSDGSEAPYKHVCKVRLPAESEPKIDLESDDGEDRIVLRAADRTCYRHSLPTPVSVAN